MTALLPRKFSYLSGFCLLVIVNLACSLPMSLQRRSPEETLTRMTDAGFSKSARLLEIQLPLKLASGEDLIAWAKYVMGLMASKINITLTTLKDSTEMENDGIMKPMDMSRLPLEPVWSNPAPTIQISGTKPSITSPDPSFNDRSVNFEVSSIQDMNIGSPFGTKGRVTATEWTKDPNTRSHLELQTPLRVREGQFFPSQFTDLARKTQQVRSEISRSSNAPIPPSYMYLPLPVKTSEPAKFINDMFTTGHVSEGAAGNISRSSRVSHLPDTISATRKSAIPNRQLTNVTFINENESGQHRNISTAVRPILTLPFEAVITITREGKPEAYTPIPEQANYMSIPIRDPPDEFPPYFEKNYTITNESGQVNVILEDIGDNDGAVKDENSLRNGNSKRDRSKKTRSGSRQSAALLELIKMLGTRRKSEDSNLPTDLTPPASKPATAIQSERVQLAEQQDDVGQDRRNETSQAQEFEDDGDYDDENGGMGGSIQSLLELLPLVAPIIEDLSDPESDTDFVELLQAAIPILEGLSEGDGDGPPPDFPAIFLPILLNIIRGRDGEGSDVNAILGPLIKLSAPFIGPIVGPLIGPLSQQSSNPSEEGGSNFGTLVQAIVGPLSMPTGPGKTSPFSNLIAGVISSLSKELVSGKSGLDLKSVVSAIVSGTIWGTSAALSAPKDTAYAPTSYGNDGGYGYGVPANSVNPFALLGSSIKDILTSVLKVSSTLIQALSSILGASSQNSPKPYGAPPNYGPPPSSQAQQNYPTTTRAPQPQRSPQKNRASRKQTAG